MGLLVDCDVRGGLRSDKAWAEKFNKFFVVKDAVKVPVLNVFSRRPVRGAALILGKYT